MTSRVESAFARARAWSPAERAAGAACALAGAGLLAWAARLWPEWRQNPDLSHGFLAVPVVVVLWIRARALRTSGPGPAPGAQTALALGAGAALLAATLLATVYAVGMDWSATPTLFLLGAVAALALGLAAILAAGRPVRWIGAGWPVAVMLAVVLLSAPLPPGTYARLTAGLQEGITVAVVGTLRFFGVPALREGNIIDLGVASVGVEEACSGVRSLVSCVLAGLVLSALLLRSPWRRALLVAVAAPLAIATNFLRSLALTLLARGGTDITGSWHDGLGFAVLGVTAGLLAALAFALEDAPPRAAVARSAGGGPLPASGWRTASAAAFLALGASACWFVYVAGRTEAAPAGGADEPDLAAIIPARAAGWRVATRADLPRFAGILMTDHLLERSYSKIGDNGGLAQVTVYAAWWPAGTTSVTTVAAHTPAACWPGAGWTPVPEGDGRRDLRLAGGAVAGEAEQRSFVYDGYPQTVWFWHLVDGRPMEGFDPRSWREQLGLFFKRGVTGRDAQAFVRISSNRPWAEIADEPLVAEVVAGFATLGLPVR